MLRKKIYTKTGDTGETSLIGGKRVPKYDIRIDAYGTVDELNSHTGLLKDMITEQHTKGILTRIQNSLFTAGALLACENGCKAKTLPLLKPEDISLLETEIDTMNSALPELHSFILPGGNTVVSHCHIARCVCRRAERTVALLSNEDKVDELILKYLNRLSDYLFVLARWIAMNTGAEETQWKEGI